MGGYAKTAAALLVVVVAAGCGSEGNDAPSGDVPGLAGSTAGTPAAGIGGASGAAASAGSSVTAGTAGAPVAGAAGAMPPVAGAAGATPPVAGAAGAMPPVAGAAGAMPPAAGAAGVMEAGTGGEPVAGASGTMAPPSDVPEDGDPNAPVVSLPDVACRDGGGGAFGFPSPNLQVDGRDVILDYPCNKHEGAPMTFILNLHGTTPVSQHFYQEGYFSAYQFAASHNLIIATPSSVVEQWGNGDNGEDEPYLMHVIDYVYQNLGDKFQIKQMWVGGHSWGAFYASTYVCRDYLADKVKGVIIMSGSPSPPACSDRISVIDTNAEMDIGPPLNQGNWPMAHGCDGSMMQMVGNNTETFWPNCDPGFVHANYLMLGKGHIDFMDREVVESLVDWIKLSRQTQP